MPSRPATRFASELADRLLWQSPPHVPSCTTSDTACVYVSPVSAATTNNSNCGTSCLYVTSIKRRWGLLVPACVCMVLLAPVSLHAVLQKATLYVTSYTLPGCAACSALMQAHEWPCYIVGECGTNLQRCRNMCEARVGGETDHKWLCFVCVYVMMDGERACLVIMVFPFRKARFQPRCCMKLEAGLQDLAEYGVQWIPAAST